MRKSPYKFLDSYSKEDRDIFFGRDKEIEELHSRVFENRILVVYGTSGTGKSSLINCGLANKFNDSDWLPVTVRRGLNINQSLSDSLEKASITMLSAGKKDQQAGRSVNIARIIQSIYLDHFKPVYIIFDQFEELFIFGSIEEKEELISSVKKVISSDIQCRFIFCIREEYLAGFTEFEKVIPSFLANRIRIEKMTRQHAMQVIEGPCRLSGIEVENGFSEKLLDKLNPGNPEVELTWLQVYIDKIFRIASKRGEEVSMIGSSLLEEVGEVKDLLGTFLEEQISQLDDPGSGLVILKSFVSVKGTKQQVTEEEVIEYSRTFGKDIDREKAKDLIQKFIKLRILRDKDENGRYELRHDSLATKIYEKITLVEKELLEIRQFLDNAYNSYERRNLFLTADDLSYIAPYEDKLFLNERVHRFIHQSKRSIQKARRRRQNVFIISAGIIIAVLTFFTVWAFRERGNALDQKRFADEQRISAIKQGLIADSARVEAVRSQALADEKAIQAVQAQQQSEAARKEAISERENALQQKRIAERLSVQANEQAQIANSERLKAEQERSNALAAESRARRLGLLSTAQNLALKSNTMEKSPDLMGLLSVEAFVLNRDNDGPSGDPLIYEALHRAWTMLDSSRHQLFSGSPNEVRTMVWKGDVLLTADYDGIVRSWNYEGTNVVLTELLLPGPVDFVKFSPSGKYLVYGYENSDLFLTSTDQGSKFEQKLAGHLGLITSAAFTADEGFLATGAGDSLVNIWKIDGANAERTGSIKLKAPARVLEFCGNDTLVSAFEQNSLQGYVYYIQWNSIAGNYIFSESQLKEKPLCLSYNEAEGKLYAGFSSGSVKRYDFRNNGINQHKYYNLHSAGVDQIVFTNDGTLAAVSCWDKMIRFYDFNRYFRLNDMVGGTYQLKGLTARSRVLAFDSSNRLISSMGDNTIRIWETSSEKICANICSLVRRNMTEEEWKDYVGTGVPFQRTCGVDPYNNSNR
jgi:hypothetical protein